MYLVKHTPPLLGVPITLGTHDTLTGALQGLGRVFDPNFGSRSDGYKRNEDDYQIAKTDSKGKVNLLLTIDEARTAAASGAFGS